MRKTKMLAIAVILLISIASFAYHFRYHSLPGKLLIKIDAKPAVMSLAYKVYANRDIGGGRYWLSKVTLYNDGGKSLKNVSVSYQVPGHISWTTPKTYKELQPGQTVVDMYYPKLPHSVSQQTTVSTERVEIEIDYEQEGKIEQEFRQVDFQMRGRNDMLYTTLPLSEINSYIDLYENTELSAVFVTPEDPVIKYFTQQLQEKVMGGTRAGVTADVNEVVRFMRAFYQFQLVTGMVYAGTKGLPEVFGDSYSQVQHVRLPREVLTGNAGLCIELVNLFASVAASAGLEPVAYLTQRHAFLGIKINGQIIPFETTGIGGVGLKTISTFEEAHEAGVKNQQLWEQGGGGGIGHTVGLLDISALQTQGIRPPELPDNPELRIKIDQAFDKYVSFMNKLAEKAESQNEPSAQQHQNPAANQQYENQPSAQQPLYNSSAPQPQNRPSPQVSRTRTYNQRSLNPLPSRQVPDLKGMTHYDDPDGTFSISYPSNWQISRHPVPEAPWLVVRFSDLSWAALGNVFVFEGILSVDTALNHMVSLVNSVGGQVQYAERGTVTLNGVNFRSFQGVTSIPGSQSREWVLYYTVSRGATIGFSLGTQQGNLPSFSALFSAITETFTLRG